MTSLPHDQPVMPEPDGTANDPLMPVVLPIVDPMARTLDALEASIEEWGDAFFTEDPMARTLRGVEESVVCREPDPHESSERFLTLFGPSEEHGPEPAADEGKPNETSGPSLGLREDGPANILTGSSPLRAAPLALPHVDRREPFAPREHAQPTYHMMGGGAGIRNNGPDEDLYCRLREEWVAVDDCGSCDDFEREGAGTEGDHGRCRHASRDDDDEDERPEGESVSSEDS